MENIIITIDKIKQILCISFGKSEAAITRNLRYVVINQFDSNCDWKTKPHKGSPQTMLPAKILNLDLSSAHHLSATVAQTQSPLHPLLAVGS